MSNPSAHDNPPRGGQQQQMQRLWDAVSAPSMLDTNSFRYRTDQMDRDEARAFEANLACSPLLLAELQTEREELRLARRTDRIYACKQALTASWQKMAGPFATMVGSAGQIIRRIRQREHEQRQQSGFADAEVGFADGQGDEIATDDRQVAIRITPETEQRQVRVMVEIEDVDLDGVEVTLSWKPDGEIGPKKLARPSEQATVVKAVFFLTEQQAVAAKDGDIQVNLLDS